MMICFEGNDAVGKTTQTALLVQKIASIRGKPVAQWKFPHTRNSPTGEAIYSHLRGEWSAGTDTAHEHLRSVLDGLVFQALQVANRLEVLPELLKDIHGGHVVVDRYWASGYAYGTADGLDGKWVESLHALLPQPDVTFLLDGGPELITERRPGTTDRYEKNAKKMVQVRSNYLELAERKGFVVIDASRPMKQVADAIWAELKNRTFEWRIA